MLSWIEHEKTFITSVPCLCFFFGTFMLHLITVMIQRFLMQIWIKHKLLWMTAGTGSEVGTHSSNNLLQNIPRLCRLLCVAFYWHQDCPDILFRFDKFQLISELLFELFYKLNWPAKCWVNPVHRNFSSGKQLCRRLTKHLPCNVFVFNFNHFSSCFGGRSFVLIVPVQVVIPGHYLSFTLQKKGVR